jgi:hypothetical protein
VAQHRRDAVTQGVSQHDVNLPDKVADAVIAVIREANDDIRPALRDALASWDDYDPYEAKADAERQQWADDEGIPR